MSTLALSLVLISAFLHASWNLLGKKQAPSMAFFALAMAAGAVFFSPVLFFYSHWTELPIKFWSLLLISGLFQTMYMAGLAWAYARGEISVLYPLARALPVILVPLVAWLLWNQNNLTHWDQVGMGLIVCASFLMPLRRLRDIRWSTYCTPALGFMLLAALGTAGYSLVDKQAVDLIMLSGQSAAVAGVSFMVLQAFVTATLMLCACWLLKFERKALKQLLSLPRPTYLLAGVMMLATYGLVLMAMGLTEEVSYVVALRQVSIPIGAVMGFYWLKEPQSTSKWSALLIMMTGLVIVALQ